MKKFVTFLVVLALIAALAIWQRHRILVPLATTGERIPAAQEANLPDGGVAMGEDNYWVVVKLDSQTFAIAEPYSWARNVNYLILGEERAILFDAGVGHFDIRPIVKELTDLPVTFLPSHLHYDHTGQVDFERIALVDLPHLREQEEDGKFSPTWGQSLASAEGIERPSWIIDEWIAPGSKIDLGNRKLTLLYTPGHTDNSISLHDQARGVMFTGDFYSAGNISAYYPTASMADYLASAELVLAATAGQPNSELRGAHSSEDGQLPIKSREDITILRDALLRIRNGSLPGNGTYPVVYVIDKGVTMQAEPEWLQNWERTYPDREAAVEAAATE